MSALSYLVVRVGDEWSVTELGSDRIVKQPKARAAVRMVALLTLLVPELSQYPDTCAGTGPDGRVFVGP
jgi:hypothetical protein